jgi:hypothetical protein
VGQEHPPTRQGDGLETDPLALLADILRVEAGQALRARLLALLPKAADCLETSLTMGDTKSAIALLKGLGFLPGPPRPE